MHSTPSPRLEPDKATATMSILIIVAFFLDDKTQNRLFLANN